MRKYKSYLDIIQFDPNLAKSFVAKYIANIRIVILVVVGILAFGISSLIALPRRLNPEVEIPIVSVSTILPGAAPDEIERLISIPLEKELQNAKKLDTISSTSQESVSRIVLQFFSDVSPEEAQDEVQRLVNNVTNLPDDATTPSVRALDFEDVPIWQFALTSKSGDMASLDRISSQLQDVLEETQGVERVILSGKELTQVRVSLDQEKIAEYGLDPFSLSTAIKQATQAWPAGNTVGSANSFSVAIDAQIDSVEKIAQLPIQVQGQTMALGDVAEVQRQSAPAQKRAFVMRREGEPEPAISFSVFKTRVADIGAAQSAAQTQAEKFLTPYQESVELITLTNTAQDITAQFDDLLANFATTILLVFITLFVFLGLRQAVLTSFAIPLAFLSAFIVMNSTGQSLNFLSLFSLLIALGLLVDNAIVIITSLTEYHKSGKFAPLQTGLLVYRDFSIPIWTTTLTTVWAFLPLLLATGIIGEFIKPIPIIVSSTLLSSALIALFITLPLMVTLLDMQLPKRVRFLLGLMIFAGALGLLFVGTRGNPLQPVILLLGFLSFLFLLRWRRALANSFSQWCRNCLTHEASLRSIVRKAFDNGVISMSPITTWYQDKLSTTLSSKKAQWQVVGAVVIVLIFSYILVPLGFVKNEFFPASEADVVYVTLELPAGTSLAVTELEAIKLLEKVSQTTDVEYGLVAIGQSSGQTNSLGGTTADNTAAITLRLIPEENRSLVSAEVVQTLRNQLSDYQKGKISVSAPSGGPPTGSAVTVQLLGEELPQLQQYGTFITREMQKTAGVVNVEQSIKPGASKIIFDPYIDQLSEFGLSLQSVGFWMRTALTGFELATFTPKSESEELPIVLYLSEGLTSPETLSALPVQQQDKQFTLGNLGTMRLAPNPASITRENGKRSLTITADVEDGFSAPEINQQIFAWIEEQDFLPGYEVVTGGANEENQKSVQSILLAMTLSVILILATMVVQLGSFRKALIIVMVIPLAITGVFLIFALTGTPLSFPALIGVLALFGIVVNNSIVLVDKINENRHVGMTVEDAVIDASGSRLQPIFFSSLTTIIGLIPITLSDPIWQGLGGALIAGLSFSGISMLFFIPVVYMLMFGGEDKKSGVKV